MSIPARVTIYEVGPRDGLQNEARMVPTADKIAFIDALSRTGLPNIEITSFVNPRWIPQLADAAEVSQGITRQPNVAYSALVPNRKGMDSALAAGMREIAVFLSASETHNKKNVNKTIAETLAAFEEVVAPAKAQGVKVRAYVSTVYGCPYEGDVDPRRAVSLVKTLRDMGVYQVSLGDTIGVANPMQVQRVLELVLAEAPEQQIAMHFHDTRGTALANCFVGLQLGVSTIDAAVGGLGGCPYAPGASGNLATEDVVAMLHAMGIATGVDLDKLVACSQQVAALVGHELPSKYLKAHLGGKTKTEKNMAYVVKDVLRIDRRDGGAVWLTIAREEAMNALSGEVLSAMVTAVTELGADPTCRAVVVTGAGHKAFSAGADLKERRGMTEAQTRVRIDLINDAFNKLARMPKPTIAALNGVAFGGGLELALACDLRVAVEAAQLGLTEVRLGIMPGAGGTQRLTRVVGVARAKQLILLGRRITAAQAHAIGLVNEVVPADALEQEVRRMVDELQGSAPVSVAMAKAAIDRGIDVVLEEGLRIERACYEVTLATEDRNEGLRAFAEKRAPKYVGK